MRAPSLLFCRHFLVSSRKTAANFAHTTSKRKGEKLWQLKDVYKRQGYGYGDRGRDVLDEVYARALGAEDALCRYNFVSGTHTLTVALFGVLRPGDTMLSVTGMPYDTLRGVIGITGCLLYTSIPCGYYFARLRKGTW